MTDELAVLELDDDEQEVAEIDPVAAYSTDDDDDETVEEAKPDPMSLIKAIAARAALGHTEKLSLTIPGMGVLEDERFYIVFNDANSQAVDAWMDAMNQFKSTENMQVDEETGLVVGEQKVEQHRRAWPMLDVLIDYGVVREAKLPAFNKDGSLAIYEWSTNPARNRKFLMRGKQLTITMLLSMAGEHILGGESTQELMSRLGE